MRAVGFRRNIAEATSAATSMYVIADVEPLRRPVTGDVIEPEHDLMAIGSGGPYAQAAALALLQNTDLGAREIAERALTIAGDICVYTNQNIVVEELG